MVRVILPVYLQRLANIEREIQVSVDDKATFSKLIDTLESKFPMLQGTIRDHDTKERRQYLRFFACGQDFSQLSLESQLPKEILDGKEPLRIVGAMSGG